MNGHQKSDWEKIEKVLGAAELESILNESRRKDDDDPGPTFCFDCVQPAEQRWLWPGRIPVGSLTALLAPRGTGKSMIALDIAARVTKGMPWPDAPEVAQSPGSVLVVAQEDDLETTVVPRLIAAGADLAKVHGLTPEMSCTGGLRPFNLTDLKRLEDAMRSIPDLRLVVIDPYASVLGYSNDRRYNTHANKLLEVAQIASEVGAAVLFVNATDKGSNGKTWDYACDGLPALESLARAVWVTCEDPEDYHRRMFLPARVNLGADPGGLSFTIDRQTGRVVWGTEPIALRASDVRPSGRAATEVVKAVGWLREFLSKAARRAEEALRAGMLAGFSRRSVYAAKERLRVSSAKDRDRFAGRWSWQLPEKKSPAPPRPAEGVEDSERKSLAPPARAEGVEDSERTRALDEALDRAILAVSRRCDGEKALKAPPRQVRREEFEDPELQRAIREVQKRVLDAGIDPDEEPPGPDGEWPMADDR